MSLMKNGLAVLGGAGANGLSDLIVYKAVPMIPIPFIQNHPIAVRLLLSGAALLAASKFKKAELPLLMLSAHNLTNAAYTIQQVHDFVGIHGGQIDSIASEAVAAIEAGLADKVAEFKAEMEKTTNGVLSEDMGNPMSTHAEELSEDMHDLIYS